MGAHFIFNLIFSSLAISLCSILARKEPRLAGFIVSLPLSTMLVLAFSYLQDKDASKTNLLAKSIFVGLPLSLTFFIPFLIADRMKLTFWQAYAGGVLLIGASYFAHKAVFGGIQ